MKKIYFLIALMTIAFSQAQIINIPDANLKAKLLAADVTNNIAQNNNYQNIKIDINSNNEIEVSEALLVYNLFVAASQSQTTNLISDISGLEAFANLKYLNLDFNNISSLNATLFPNLQQLHVSYNPLTSLNVNNLLQLKWLWCRSTQLTTLNISNLPNLEDLRCNGNQLTSINLNNKPNLKILYCSNNNFSTLDFTGLSNLEELDFSYNPIALIDVSGNTKLKTFNSMYTNVQMVNVMNQSNLKSILVGNNPSLQYVFMKNGSTESGFNFMNVPNLKYICVDPTFIELLTVQNHVNSIGSSCVVGSYCSFSPGGASYILQGNTKYDSNNNGCDANDVNITYQKFNIAGMGVSGSFFGNNAGNYSIPVQAGSHTLTPVLENPSYFNISPSTITVTFPTQSSPSTQNFCLTANGTHNDLEVVIIPITAARPGFNTTYKIVYKNNGNTTQSGTVSFNYNDNVTDYLSSTVTSNSQSTGLLSWNFSNLLPFETREITVTLKMNTPTQTPALNGGDILHYTAQVNGAADETSADNTFTLNQTVVNSFDPNDKTCLEGTSIALAKVGDYVHYLIRFENTGTANAQNIVVKDEIDASKFDISSLISLHGSHNFVTRITGNTVEFIFENIQLPFNNATNDGYVSFKIKTKSALTAGNSFSNTAKIYFDYNFPIVTNTYTTTVQNVLAAIETGKPENNISVYPNPARDTLYFKAGEKILRAEIYDAAGRIISSVNPAGNSMDVSGLAKGNYHIRLSTKEKSVTRKFIRN